jgi:hypothetical protein
MKSILAACAALLFAVPAAADTPAEAFARLKRLAGRWEGNIMTPDGPPGTVVYDVSSGGSIVRERMFVDTPHEMTTVYYMDGADLVGIHYCASGNQPRLRLVPGPPGGDLAFEFAGGANVDPAKGTHMHSARFRFTGPDRLESEWEAWKDGKKDHLAKFYLSRKK